MTGLNSSALDSSDLAPLLELNNANASELSWLEGARFAALVGRACLARRIGRADALVLAFDQDADYDGLDYLYVRSRYRRFVYVDRIVVAAAFRGRGYARSLYHDVFRYAAEHGHTKVVCEVNQVLPNPVLDAFHAAMGFVPVGSAAWPDGSKIVRYFVRDSAISS